MKFKRGQSGNPKGRPPGTPNKATAVVRESLEVALVGEIAEIPQLLKALEPKDRLEAISRLLPYVSPRLQAAYIQESGNLDGIIEIEFVNAG